MNRKILISTIVRNALSNEPSATICLLGLASATVRRVAVPEAAQRKCDPNPRGGMRGARGVAVAGDEILVANYDSIFRYNREWNLKGIISHPHCADIHDIEFRDERLWVASTLNDLLFQFDCDGHVKERIDLWESGGITDIFGIREINRVRTDDLRDPQTYEKALTDRFHLNSFAFAPDGDLMLSLGQMRVNGHFESALVMLGANGAARVVHHNPHAPVPSHNIVFLPDGSLLHAETANARVLRIDPRGDNPPKTVLETNGGYTRGLCLLSDGRVAVGVQNECWIVELETGEIMQRIRISDDLRESIHSIVVADG